MDKNMIKIDDLFAQRLAGGEESERAGAWANMRDLLDKEMPQRKPVAGFNWRRTLTVATGAVLLAALSVGGYEKFTSFRNAKNADMTVSAPAGNSIGTEGSNIAGTNGNASSSSNDNLNSNDLNSNSNNSGLVPSVAANNDNTSASANNNASSDNNKNSNTVADTKSGKKVVKSVSGDLKITSSGTNVAVNKPLVSNQPLVPAVAQPKNVDQVADDNKLVSNNKVKSGGASDPGGANITPRTQPSGIMPSSGNNVVANTSGNNIKPAEMKPVTDKSNKKDNTGNTTGNNNDKKASNDDVAKKEKMFKDSIKLVETKERFTAREGWKRDTVQQGKMARFDVMPVDPAKATQITDIIPSAAITVNNNEGAMELLEKKRVSTRKFNSGIAESRFEEMVKNAKFNMARVTFHSGIIGGVNSSIAGSNTTMGIQMGLYGVANFGERWSMVAEVKYMQRWGGSNTIIDNYNNNKYETPAATQGFMEHSWDSVVHSFKYPSLNSVHLPVSVRYAMNRVSLFCGADFAYNFAVNTEEIQQQAGIKVTQVTPLNAQGLRYDLEKTRPGITYKDFSSRLDLGAMIGVSYNVTPSTMLDLRMVQSVWNDAKTAGEIKVFDALYNKPSVQFNISYRFGNNKFRAYRR